MSPIIDLIIIIKNGYLSHLAEVESPHSNFREAVVKKLMELGYIADYQLVGEKNKKIIIKLKYNDSLPAITDIKLFSRPGRRWYVNVKYLKPVLGGLGHALISTPKGVLTDKEAVKLRVGGELLFHIW